MKRLLLVMLVLMTAATFVSAQQTDSDGLWLGVTGFYDENIDSGEIWDGKFFDGDVSYGIDARLRFDLIELSFLGISNPFSGNEDRYLTFYNAGGNLSLAPFNIGMSIGMNFDYNDATEETVESGVNTKISADVMFGSIAVGGYYMAIADNFRDIDFDEIGGYVGLSVLYKL